jgi:MFS family permease
MNAPAATEKVAPQKAELASFKQLTPQQWRTGIAAWLGWTFDGLDMHLYTLVAAPFVMELVHAASVTDASVKVHSSYIQAAFLIGWALGGGFFGRLGDVLGRSRALSLTILTYALFTGLSFFAKEWWHLLIFRFVAALGIGGEWAVGSSLLSETWPKRWRPWIAAVLQTGVNIGVLAACVTNYLRAELSGHAATAFLSAPRLVFLVGIVPAFLVYWIRRAVPEPEEWAHAKKSAVAPPKVSDLFGPEVRKTTLLTITVCACSLTAWWAFMFWNPQHLRNLPDLVSWNPEAREKLVTINFFTIIAVSSVGNFFAGWLATKIGYRRAIALMSFGFVCGFVGAYGVPRSHESLMIWTPIIGFFSGMFGLFTMYMPPLFPTLLRTTGAGFCYNIGRIAAAVGTIYFGLLSKVGSFQTALLLAGLLFVPTIFVSFLLPEPKSLHE